MNRELFASMRSQMKPSPEAQAGLREKLAQAKPERKGGHYRKYAALAACLALAAAVVPAYRYWKWQRLMQVFQHSATIEIYEPHSYVLADGVGVQTENTADTGAVTANESVSCNRDQDQEMTPGELTDNMLEAGFTREDVDAYLSGGWQMTWAKWWKFYHQSEESGDRTLEALLDFSREEDLAVNTGDLPGGAYVVDIPVQETAAAAYQNLMAQFEKDCGPGSYPEWYGGAYIDENETLVVNIVEGGEPEDKALFLKIQDWAGTDQISFGNVKYGLGYLRDLQDRAFEAMSELGLAVGCGVNEETGQVELDLSAVTDEALRLLAELDPADDAILVRVGQAAVAEDTAASEAPDGYIHIPAPAENDVQPDNLPIGPEGAEYDLLPLEPSGVEDASPGE
ncbi:MAG: hypothetical protein HFF78_04415 [Oscillospiraceae bacterium]|nr:hypothetical protein [Oscillospiraceae bacterium]